MLLPVPAMRVGRWCRWLVKLMLNHLIILADNTIPYSGPVTFDTVNIVVTTLRNFIVGLTATVMIASIIISGLLIIVSRDNPTRFQSALAGLRSSIIGSAVVLGTT